LASVNFDLVDLSPQGLLFVEEGQTQFGLNLSHPIGQSVIAYAEWAGGRQPTLITQAMNYGEATGTLPVNAPTVLATDPVTRFRDDLAVGASWAGAKKITINFEYHYHEAGFSQRDWDNWFAVGGPQHNVALVTNEVWYIRGYANDQQQPVTRQEAFLRADWKNPFVNDLELSAFAFVSAYDGSTLTQVSASYFLSNTWTIGAYVSANVGGRHSERGTFPQAGSAILQFVRYF